jgi:hypothetical protein
LLDIDNTHIEICYQCANLFVKQEKLDEAIEVLDAVFGKNNKTDFLKTCFLFEFSSFPCTFDRCLEPVLMIQQSYNRRDVNNPFHMEREVRLWEEK